MGGGEEKALATVESEAYLPWLAGWQTHPQERACFFCCNALTHPEWGHLAYTYIHIATNQQNLLTPPS